MSNPSIYTVGGTVQANQNGVYIPRKADEELLALCRERKFAYILTSRQMGKSSLMVRTAEQLANEGIQTVVIDLTQVGVQVTAEQWYLGLLTIIEGTLMLDTDVMQWWQERSHLGFTQRLTSFFQDVLLKEVASPVVIFVDEIDTTLSLDFTDDFFAAIRYLYNARSQKPEFQRLSFVLIGVATPGDLIRDPKRTPFNIGQRVDLTDFTSEEAKPLAKGLELSTDEAQQVLRWVLEWTSGHPYLSQRLCCIISQQDKKSWSQADVDRLVSSTFLGVMSEQDNNLQFVRDMLTKRAPDLESVLTTYREIRRSKRPVLDEEQSIVKSHLKLSGVVRRENAVLQVGNRIYRQAFDERWIKEHLPISSKLPLKAVFSICIFVTAWTLGIRELKWLQPWELRAYDQMLRLRPTETPDRRILLVNVTEDDFKQHGWPLSDSKMNQVLAKLQSYQPRVIGVNIYAPEQTNLGAGLKRRDNIFSTCAFSSVGTPEIAPPLNFPIDNVGFTDLISDEDSIVRRSLLFANSSEDKRCTTNFSFAALVAIKYLQKEGIEVDFSDENNFKLVDTHSQKVKASFKILDSNAGSYKSMDDGGYQIMLNYRHPDSLAQEVTFSQVLNGSINPNWIKDRLVIIGTKSPSVDRGFYTPYSALLNQPAGSPLPRQLERIPAVFIHAQIASQLLSTVLDGRAGIWFLPDWVEAVWVWVWSLLGAGLAWRLRHPVLLVVVGGVTLSGLVVICVSLFLQAGWVPLVPPATALVVSGVSVITYTLYRIRVRPNSQ